jgi:hypothetical protein
VAITTMATTDSPATSAVAAARMAIQLQTVGMIPTMQANVRIGRRTKRAVMGQKYPMSASRETGTRAICWKALTIVSYLILTSTILVSTVFKFQLTDRVFQSQLTMYSSFKVISILVCCGGLQTQQEFPGLGNSVTRYQKTTRREEKRYVD